MAFAITEINNILSKFPTLGDEIESINGTIAVYKSGFEFDFGVEISKLTIGENVEWIASGINRAKKDLYFQIVHSNGELIQQELWGQYINSERVIKLTRILK